MKAQADVLAELLDPSEQQLKPHRITLPHLLTALLVVWAVGWAQSVLIPVVCGILISYALEPFVARLQSCHVPRACAVPVVLLATAIGIGAGGYAIRDEAVNFVERLPDSAHIAAESIRSMHDNRSGLMAKAQRAAKELETATGVTPPSGGVPVVRVEESSFKWEQWMLQGSHGALVLATQLGVVLCLVYYLMASGDLFKRKLMRIVGPSISEKKLTIEILKEIDRQIERFLLSRLLISAVVGVAVWVAFWLIDLNDGGIWAVLAGLLFMIPVVGPAIVIAGTGLSGLVQTGSPQVALMAAGASTVIAAIEGNVLAPWLMGRLGEMNAVAVFVSLLFWGWLWGAWGLLLAVPITGATKAVCERVEGLSVYAELLKP